MNTPDTHIPRWHFIALVAAAAVPLTIGGAEAAGLFKEPTGFESAIRVMGNTKWGDIE